MVRYAIISASIAFVLGCADDPGPADAGTGDARTSGCASAADCNDSVACTEDTCEGGTCAHRPTISSCAAGSVCDARRGCQPGRACSTSDDCRDADPCTVNERCDPSARLCLSDSLDGDRDGHTPRSCGGDDCDDADAFVYGRGTEYCNGRDDDCDGIVDNLAGPICQRSYHSAAVVGGVCAGNTCVCREGQTRCLSGCSTLSTDPANCGACDVSCGSGNACSGGTCRCQPGRTRCPSAPCADLQTDRYNCGRCGGECADGSECREGTCR